MNRDKDFQLISILKKHPLHFKSDYTFDDLWKKIQKKADSKEKSSFSKNLRKYLTRPAILLPALSAIILLIIFIPRNEIIKEEFNFKLNQELFKGSEAELSIGEVLSFTHPDIEIIISENAIVKFSGKTIEIKDGFISVDHHGKTFKELKIITPVFIYSLAGTKFSVKNKGKADELRIFEGKVAVKGKESEKIYESGTFILSDDSLFRTNNMIKIETGGNSNIEKPKYTNIRLKLTDGQTLLCELVEIKKDNMTILFSGNRLTIKKELIVSYEKVE